MAEPTRPRTAAMKALASNLDSVRHMVDLLKPELERTADWKEKNQIALQKLAARAKGV